MGAFGPMSALAAGGSDDANATGPFGYGAPPRPSHIGAMSGRVLLAIVCVIIAAGLLLPFYPRGVDAPSTAAVADAVLPVAGFEAFGCAHCPVADARTDCQSDCACIQVLPAAAPSVEGVLSFTVFVVVGSQPSGLPSEPQPLPPKLPAI